MSRVDSAPLAQEVAHRRGTAVVDDRLWLVDQPVPELRDDRLDRDLVHRRVGRNARNHVPERDDLTELRRFARDSVMEAPLQMDRVPQERRLGIDRDRMAADHSHAGILEVAQQRVDRAVLDQHVGAHHEQNGERSPRR